MFLLISGLAIIVSSKEVFLLRRFSFCSVLQSLRFTPILFEGQYSYSPCMLFKALRYKLFFVKALTKRKWKLRIKTKRLLLFYFKFTTVKQIFDKCYNMHSNCILSKMCRIFSIFIGLGQHLDNIVKYNMVYFL